MAEIVDIVLFKDRGTIDHRIELPQRRHRLRHEGAGSGFISQISR